MNKFYYFALCAGLSLATFTACDKDDDDEKSGDSTTTQIVNETESNFKFNVISDNEVEVSGIVNGTPNMVIPEKVRIDGNVYTVTSIGRYIFDDYEDYIKSVSLPNSITEIGDDAFADCYNMTSVNIPDGVKSIGKDAFEGCESLTKITIPSSVETIGMLAFAGCNNADIIVDNNVKDIKYIGWDEEIISEKQVFPECKSITFKDQKFGNFTDPSYK